MSKETLANIKNKLVCFGIGGIKSTCYSFSTEGWGGESWEFIYRNTILYTLDEFSLSIDECVFIFTALGVVGSGCDAVRSYAEIVLGWPDISFIIDGINDVYGALEPILDFFEHLQNALNTELCIPDPFEAIAEWELIE